MYIRKEYDLGNIIQVENHFPGNYGAPGRPRAKKRNRTPEEIQRQNHTNRCKKIQRLILANFKEGDWHLILKYKPDERPETLDEAQNLLKTFLARLRRAYKKKGYPLKYIAVTERGKKGQALHHHLIIQNFDITCDLVKKLWKGFKNFIDLYDEGDYAQLADYIGKIETKEQERGKSLYSRSRNLINPKPKRQKMLRRCWPEEPKPKKGYIIDKFSIVNGINPVTGYPYQHYTMRKVVERWQI